MELLDKNTRDDLGIDSLGRGLTFATHLLKIVTPESDLKYTYTENIVDDLLKGNLNIVTKLRYTKSIFLGSGSDYMQGVIPKEIDLPTIGFSPMEPSVNTIPINTEPTEVTSLEAYFVWLLLEYKKYGFGLNPIQANLVTITHGETNTEFTKTFTVDVPYNPVTYALTGNIIAAVLI